jgi:hypothetical protein
MTIQVVPRFLDTLDFHLEGPTSKRVVLDAPLRYLRRPGLTITVPEGFVNDLASVPKLLTALAPRWQQSARAGVLHDYLYRVGLHSRREADVIFREALRADGVGWFRAWVMYRAVRRFAGTPWRAYREAESA